jgi:ERCC4-type nuclease
MVVAVSRTPSDKAAVQAVILADRRERAGGVVSYLEGLAGVRVEWAHLLVADFLLDSHERPLLVLEGDPLTTELGVHPNAIRGALAHLAVARRLPILPSAGPQDTAELLAVIARRVQGPAGERPRAAAKRRAGTIAQHQEAVAASLPGVGAVLARRLLEHSGSLAALAGADARTLREVPGIGPQRAQRLTSLLAAPYRPEDDREQPPVDDASLAPAAGTTL